MMTLIVQNSAAFYWQPQTSINMLFLKKEKISCLLAGLLAASCYAQDDKRTEQFEKVFDVISSERIFATPFSGVLKNLHGVCTPSAASGDDLLKKGNVACEKSSDVRRFSMPNAGSEPVTMI